MRLFLTISLAFLLAAPVFSRNTANASKDSLAQTLELDNLRKIAFKDGGVVATYSDGTTRSHRLSANEQLQFSVADKQDEGISADEDKYTIYDLSGRPVKTHTDRNCDQPFDLNDLTSGIYLLKTGNRTIKIVK